MKNKKCAKIFGEIRYRIANKESDFED